MNTLADFRTTLTDLKLTIHGAIVLLTCRSGFIYIKFTKRLLTVAHVGHDEVPVDVYLDKLSCAEDTMRGESSVDTDMTEIQLEDMSVDQLMWVLEQMEGGFYEEISLSEFNEDN